MKQLFIILFNIFSLVTNLAFYLLCDSFNKDVFGASLIMGLISVFLFLISSKERYGHETQTIRVSIFFVIGYTIVFFQKNIDLLLGFIDSSNQVFCNPSVIVASCALCVIGISSFTLGQLFGVSHTTLSTNKYDVGGILISKRLLRFAFISVVFAYLALIASDVLSGNYYYNEDTMNENAGSISNYLNVFVYVFMFITLTVNSYQLRSQKIIVFFWDFIKMNGWLFNAAAVLYLFFAFLMGDRGPIITFGLAFLISFVVSTGKKYSATFLIVIIIAGSLLMSAISQVRAYNNLVSLSDVLSYEYQNEEKSISPYTVELANSYNTLAYSVNNIPSQRTYFFGRMQIRELLYSIPFMHRVFPFVYSSKPYENGTTNYCSFLIQGLNRTYGNGSSILADIYIDFGVVGVIFIMFCMGFFLYKLDIELSEGSNIYWMLISIVYFSFSFYLSRSTLTTPLYYIIPAFLIIKCMTLSKDEEI